MDLLHSPLGVALILLFVAIAAFSFQPSRFPGKWQTLVNWFATDTSLPRVNFENEPVEVSGLIACDVSVDDGGLWLQAAAESPATPFSLYIPWIHFRHYRDNGKVQQFEIKKDAATRTVVRLTVRDELGAAMRRRVPDRES